jgi:hypothetical protein
VENSSAQTDKKSKNEVRLHFDNFKGIEDGALMLGGQRFGLIKVKDHFNIELDDPYHLSWDL